MSRVIKFRAWAYGKMQTTSENWGGDIFVRLNGETVVCIDTGEWEEGLQVSFDKEEVVLMQFTGLLDKNGKEIYEGDILRAETTLGLNGPEHKYHDAGVVKWFDYQWIPFDAVDPERCEVVGNIYENPELLQNAAA